MNKTQKFSKVHKQINIWMAKEETAKCTCCLIIECIYFLLTCFLIVDILVKKCWNLPLGIVSLSAHSLYCQNKNKKSWTSRCLQACFQVRKKAKLTRNLQKGLCKGTEWIINIYLILNLVFFFYIFIFLWICFARVSIECNTNTF